MLTAAFYILILFVLLVVLSGFSDAARSMFSFLSRRRAVHRLPRPHFVSAASLKSLRSRALSLGF